jgi:hypothetical protein
LLREIRNQAVAEFFRPAVFKPQSATLFGFGALGSAVVGRGQVAASKAGW